MLLLNSRVMFATLWLVFAGAHAEDLPWVKIEPVGDHNSKDLPESYRFMVADFVEAGGRGRTFLVHSNEKEVAGPYFAVDRFPPSVAKNGVSIFTRDPKILDLLKSINQDGVPVLLQSIDHKIDAQILGDDDLGRSLRKVAFPQSNKTFLFSASPSMTLDVFVHERAHIDHREPSHPLSQFLDSLKMQVDVAQLRKIRRALTELFAYQAQYHELQRQKRLGTKKILVLGGNPPRHQIEHVDFEKFRERRNKEIQISAGMYLQMISSELRRMPSSAHCRTIDQARNAIAGMGEMETALLEENIGFTRCPSGRDPVSSGPATQ